MYMIVVGTIGAGVILTTVGITGAGTDHLVGTTAMAGITGAGIAGVGIIGDGTLVFMVVIMAVYTRFMDMAMVFMVILTMDTMVSEIITPTVHQDEAAAMDI